MADMLTRAYELIRHDDGCNAIGGNGDADCNCDAVPFLRALELALSAQPAPAGEVALPEPYTRDEKFGFPYWGEKQLRAYGDARAAAAASRPATAVPEARVVPTEESGAWPSEIAEARGWNACREAMLSAALQPEAINSHPEIPDNSVDTPQPTAVKQDLTTAQGESTDLTSAAKRLYGSYTDNHPTMHCNRFATWDDLGAEQQNEWLHRARMRGLAAIEQASYVGAGGHGIPDEPQPEAKAGAEVTDAMIDAGYAAMRRISFAASPRERLSAMWAAMHAAQPKPAEGGAVAWIRFCSDGTHEGPIHDSQMDYIRRRSGAWTPLGVIAPAAATRAELDELLAQLREPAQVHSMMLRGVVATPSWRTIVDVRGEVPNGEDRQLSRIAELQEELDALKTGTATRAEEVEALHPSTLKWLAEEISFEHGQGEGSELGLTGDQRRLIHLERLQRFARRLAGKGAPHA